MKKLLLTLWLLVFPLYNYTQEIPDNIQQYVDEFVIDAGDIDISRLLGIYVRELPKNKYAITYYQVYKGKDFIVIADDIINEYELRFIVYHELAHIFIDKYRNKHCHELCTHIMSSMIGQDNFDVPWEKQKEILFNKQ